MNLEPYIRRGFSSRDEYLQSLADEYGLPFHVVSTVSEFNGPSEDFDGLILLLDDMIAEGGR